MRKLLLASAAMLGATSGIASAQAPTPAAANMMMAPSQGGMALPWSQGPASNNNNNAYGMPSTYKGAAAFAKNAVPTPGTVVIRLNGKVEFDALAFWTSGNAGVTATGAPNGFKINPVGFGAYMRLYPGIDGMATNGLRYGASVELRENFASGTTVSGTVPAVGSSIYTTTATGPSGYSSANTVYVRRAFAYLAADNVGILRMGQTDGVIGLFDPCIFSSQCWDAGIGNFNGGQMQAAAPGAGVAVPFVWLAQAGNEYDNTKIVYLSPQFFGLDFGVQYAPSMGSVYSNSAGASPIQPTACNQASANCIGLTTGGDGTRWYNQVGVGARWQGTFGPVNVGAYVFYETAGKESVFGPAVSSGQGVTGNRYDNLSFIAAAAYVTVDTGFGQVTWAGDYIGGAVNGQLAMRPTGGAPESAFLTGLLYRNGPLTLGAEVGMITSQGAQALTGISQRREFEVAFGGNYNIAPGLFVTAEYMYTYRHQGGFDFNNGALGAGATGVAGTAGWKPGLTRDSHGQGILLATVVNW